MENIDQDQLLDEELKEGIKWHRLIKLCHGQDYHSTDN